MRWVALLVALGAVTLGGCRNEQTIYSCRACLRADPTKCASYEGACYGPASNAMSASSTEEAQELAVQRVCSRFFEPLPPTGRQSWCEVGLGIAPEVRAAARAQYTFTCSAHVENCP